MPQQPSVACATQLSADPLGGAKGSGGSSTMPDARELFRRWYIAPLRRLEELPNGDGGFVVLATACFLYERYAKAFLKAAGDSGTTDNLIARLSADFGIPDDAARAFWNVIRDGFLHQGMPLIKNQQGNLVDGWRTCATHEHAIELDGKILKVEPWRFRDRVLDLFDSRPDLIEHNQSFLWATIWQE